MNRFFYPSVVLFVLFSFLTSKSYTQSFDWGFALSGSDLMSNDDAGKHVLLDSESNVYHFGQLFGTADMDPGIGVTSLNFFGSSNSFIQKMTPEGNLEWAISYKNMDIKDVAMDDENNFYIIGSYFDTLDLDPGIGTVNVIAVGFTDYFILKLNSDGNFVWGREIEDYWNNVIPRAITSDKNNNIYVTGYILDVTGDLDPGIGNTILTPTFFSETFLIRITHDGEFKWAHNLPAESAGNYISCGTDKQPVTVGVFATTANFDFNGGNLTLNSPSYDNYIVKYDSLGNTIWGETTELNITYQNLKLDSNNDIYLTGAFSTLVDFEPGAGTDLINTNGADDFFVQKIINDGTYDWTKTFGSGNNDMAYSVSIDSSFSIYVGGYYTSVIDFDNGIGLASHSTFGMEDYFVLKLDNNGDYIWSVTSGDSKEDYIYDIVTDKSGNLYATGFVEGTMDIDPSANNYTVSSQSRDALLLKLAVDRPNICMVTVDTTSTHNIVYWDKSLMENIDTIFVLRETTTNNYQMIASIPFDSLGRFIDTVSQLYFPYTGNPNMGTYRYKIQTKDKWGGISQKSPYHNTIFAINIFGTFDWNDYLVEGQSSPIPQLGAYLLWRDDISDGNWHVVGAVAGTQTTITDPQYPNFPNGSWRVLTDWSISCDPTRVGVNTSRSNIKNSPNAINTILENGNLVFSIYPNPATENITIESENSFENSVIRILDITGKELQNLNANSSIVTLDVSNYASGVYFIRIETELGIHLEKVTVE